jgi:5S rRNA maturation endonuclease (ribonuclease M5)
LNEYREFKRFLASKGYAVAANGANTPVSSAFKRLSTPPEGEDSDPERKTALKAALALFRVPTLEDCVRIAALRGISKLAPDLAGRIGCLLVGNVCGFESWILTDAASKIAEARRMDGKPYPATETLGTRKAHTLRGSKKNWPVGILPRVSHHQKIEKILVVEGGPDYLAALHLSILGGCDTLAVAFLGARVGRKIDPEALALFAKRRVRILTHGDENGEEASEEWALELKAAGCQVDRSHVGQIDERAKDLNDLIRLVPEKLQLEMYQILLS